ncbi:MAG: ATP phosphoribosyltransferase regulatory subunit [Candidatus Puniceispirillaceae bacterium]
MSSSDRSDHPISEVVVMSAPSAEAGDASEGLLPSGLTDLLAPQAEQDAKAVEAVLSCFAAFGYQRIKPPLVEFEQTLLAEGPGAALAEQTFRLLDPISRRMMALRSDMTAQIARIAGTRLSRYPRPVRLAYGGEVMRVVPDVLNPERQLMQAGAEIIGRDDKQAATEIILLGVRALNQAGILDLTIDLGLPRLAEAVLGDELTAMDAAVKDEMFSAISDRDISRLTKLPLKAASHLAEIIDASGAAADRLAEVAKILPDAAVDQLSGLIDIAASLNRLLPDIAITLDPLDMQGYGYHTSVSFSVFGAGLKGAIARGGAYVTGYDEKAMGLSVFMERVLRSLPTPQQTPVIYIPATVGLAAGLQLVERGRHVLYGTKGAKAEAEAKALNCAYILREAGGMPEKL